jgi:hypothetical protein
VKKLTIYPVFGDGNVLTEVLQVCPVVADRPGDRALLHTLLRGVVAPRHHLALGLVVARHPIQSLVLPGHRFENRGRLSGHTAAGTF